MEKKAEGDVMERSKESVKDLMICHGCGGHVPYGSTMYPGKRPEPHGAYSPRRFEDDYLVKCINADNDSWHPPGTGWLWASRARERGLEAEKRRLRMSREAAARAAARAKEVKA